MHKVHNFISFQNLNIFPSQYYYSIINKNFSFNNKKINILIKLIKTK